MSRPPFLARLLLELVPARHREFIIGDLEEEYVRRRLSRDGWFAAGVWYWRQTIASLISESRQHKPIVELGEPKRGSMFDTLRQDLRYTFRSLNARPVFTTVAVLTLALGIGANTGIYSIANWMMLRPVAGVSDADDLVLIEFAESPGNTVGLSWPNFTDIQKLLNSFEGLAGSSITSLQVLSEGAPPLAITATTVGGDYFGVLKVGMQRGRPIYARETEPGQHSPIAVISDRLWTQLYNRDPAVVGKTLHANKLAFTVVGVAPKGFQGSERLGTIDVWIPFSMLADLRHMDQSVYAIRGTGFRLRELIGRLKPDITVENAQADLERGLGALIAEYPKENEIYTERPVHVYAGIGVPVIQRERTALILKIMLGMVGFLLVISAANVANMLLVRATQKRSEAAMRRTLGASTTRLVMQQFAESIVISLLGGAAGLMVAGVLLRLIEGGRIFRLQTIENVPIDGRVLLFTLGVCLVTGLVFGLAPLRVLRKLNLSSELLGTSGRVTGRGLKLRNLIAITQIWLSLVLLVGALMLGRTLRSLQSIEIGFEAEGLAGVAISPEPQGYTSEQSPDLARAMLDQVRRSPAIASSAVMYGLPFSGGSSFSRAKDPLQRGSDAVEFQQQWITDGYFNTIGIRIVRGRGIEAQDWVGPKAAEIPVVLTEAAAHALFGSGDPIGRLFTEATRSPETMRVIGIAADARVSSLIEPPPPLVYLPLNALPFGYFSIVVRGRDRNAVEPELRRAVAAINPAIPPRFQFVSDNIRSFTAEQRLLSALFTLFSTLAVLLAGIGLYGVIASSVSERRREFGVRMALGANARKVLLMVALQSARLVVAGVALGLVAAYWLSQYLESQLFAVSRLDPVNYISAAVLFGVVAVVATAIPTQTATRLNPFVVLRQD